MKENNNKQPNKYRCSNKKCKRVDYDLTYGNEEWHYCLDCGSRMWRITDFNNNKKSTDNILKLSKINQATNIILKEEQ